MCSEFPFVQCFILIPPPILTPPPLTVSSHPEHQLWMKETSWLLQDSNELHIKSACHFTSPRAISLPGTAPDPDQISARGAAGLSSVCEGLEDAQVHRSRDPSSHVDGIGLGRDQQHPSINSSIYDGLYASRFSSVGQQRCFPQTDFIRHTGADDFFTSHRS